MIILVTVYLVVIVVFQSQVLGPLYSGLVREKERQRQGERGGRGRNRSKNRRRKEVRVSR